MTKHYTQNKRKQTIALLFFYLLFAAIELKAQIVPSRVQYKGNSTGNITVPGMTKDIDGNTFLVGEAATLFLMKYNSTGVEQWKKEFTTKLFFHSRIGVTADKGVVIFNTYTDPFEFEPGVTISKPAKKGDRDGFMTKYNADGNLQWTKVIGGAGARVYSTHLIIDAQGNMYITGQFAGTVDFDPAGINSAAVLTNASASGTDLFIAKYTAEGAFVWVKSIPQEADDYINDITVDRAQNVYLTGSFSSPMLNIAPGIALTKTGGYSSGYIAKYMTDGTCDWAQVFGTTDAASSGVQVNSIAIDQSEGVYIAGKFEGGVDFDHSSSGVSNAIGDEDIFLAKYSATDGSYVWAKHFGGSREAEITDMESDQYGYLHSVGSFYGTDTDFDPGAGTLALSSTGKDIFYTRFSGSGELAYGVKIGGDQEDEAPFITIGDHIYIGGIFRGVVDFDPGIETVSATSPSSTTTSGFYSAAFIAPYKFVPDVTFNNVNAVYGDNITLSASTTSPSALLYEIASQDNTAYPGNVNITGDQAVAKGAGMVKLKAGVGAVDYFAAAFKEMELNISKRNLIVRAEDKEKVEGEANPVLTLAYTGFVLGDGSSDLFKQPTASTTATESSPTGSYDIVVAADGEDENYIFDYSNSVGTLTVTSVVTGIKETATHKIALFPNPTKGITKLKLEHPSYVKVLTPSGQVAKTMYLKAGTHMIDVASLASGLYIMQIVGNNGSKSILKLHKL